VMVSAGIYYENILWPSTNGIQLLGSSEEDCIIDGDSSGSVIRFEVGIDGIIDSTTLVSDFTLQGGFVSSGSGGGVYCNNSALKLANVTITRNIAFQGNGGGLSCVDSSPILTEVTISENFATFDYIYGGGGRGGGIYCINSDPILTNVTITNNTGRQGGGIFCDNSNPMLVGVNVNDNHAQILCFPCAGSGGGIYFVDSNPTLSNVIISGNIADADESTSYGGGIQCVNSHAQLTDVTIANNQASIGGGINCINSPIIITNALIMNNMSGAGGGMSMFTSNPVLTDVTIINNSANGRAPYNPGSRAGIYCAENSNPTITNVTISGNSSLWACGGIHVSGSAPTLSNSIIWDNSNSEIALTGISDTSSIYISYCDIKGGIDSIYTSNNDTLYWGEGNINIDPLFCNSDSNDYALTEYSPCLGTGENGANMGALDMGCGVMAGYVEFNIHTIFSLNENFPNPFNPSTTLSYILFEHALVDMTIFDILGQELVTLHHAEMLPGQYEVQWNGMDRAGNQVSTGVYFCRLSAGVFSQSIKLAYLP